MAIDNANVVDGIGIGKEGKVLCMLLTDHFPWMVDDENTLSEYDHLMLLQNKINGYISYLESKQYEEIYPNEDFNIAVIKIHFKYDITDTCEKFLNSVQNQIGQCGIKLEAYIG
ncbi:DUF6572 domain-containing protein [Anaerosporobacter faecicola]|uniref:DUF6572 domain-containing protein n=1 Tax=Anaerosporobacter faecicola TaxID=2718714 RepID=UPI001439EA37|nr:DUF6572 domain-containing protein [Anaerosporobacter faecicola]